jgi:predicted DNA-binding WGR domain protein
MEKDFEGQSHWYDLNKGQYLQGLLARDGNEQRIYVVTIEPEVEDSHIHNRWPRVVQRGELGHYQMRE